MQVYKDIVSDILSNGERTCNRTGTDTVGLWGAMLKHDMSKGFPLLTTKKMSLLSIAAELAWFLEGSTCNKRLNKLGASIWDEWQDPNTKDLGPIYGKQWRDFNGVDQFALLLDSLNKEVSTNTHNSRRLVVSSWNPEVLPKYGLLPHQQPEQGHMALAPCHYSFQVRIVNGKLNLAWTQRSCDLGIGIPYNLASYGLLLLMLAKTFDLEPGILVGHLTDVHIYENHLYELNKQIQNPCYELPTLELPENFTIYELLNGAIDKKWLKKNITSRLNDYRHHGKVILPVAV